MALSVLVVDDSVVFRSQIKKALEAIDPSIAVHTASNGKLALDVITQKNFDVIILDMEMPVLDGLGTLTELKARQCKVKVIVFSSSTQRGSEHALQALRLGAFEIVQKPSGNGFSIETAYLEIQRQLQPVFNAIQFNESAPQTSSELVPKKSTAKATAANIQLMKPEVIVIGSSTGGPVALEELFAQIKGPLRIPILIAQHMPPVFTKSLASRINRITGCPADEGIHKEKLANQIYVAPGDFHMRVKKVDSQVTITLDQLPQVNSVRPAVDTLFESAAEVFGNRCLGVVLTGMGADGAKGCESIKAHNGSVIIQNKESCTVYGMPRAVAELNCFDMTADPAQIGKFLKDKVA